MPAKALMFQGTSSHAGKSVLATAFCRLLKRKGIRVAPFKAMNMSNNAWVTREGHEIAMAQAAQARACGIEPTAEMNPILLKPIGESQSQVVLLGKAIGSVPAAHLAQLRKRFEEAIVSSLEKLMASYDFLVVEGAGSPAEVNLKQTDLANMFVAKRLKAPVILIADIERGGAFAQLVGTLELLEPEDREFIKGFLINKFRGDVQLLASGLSWLEERTARPVFGVIPYFDKICIPEEDSLAERLSDVRHRGDFLRTETVSDTGVITIHVIRYPTMANFTDFDPLHREPDVEVRYLDRPPRDGPLPDLVILPGSKSTMADLKWLKERNFEGYLHRCLRSSVEILGICGGFQMLGTWIYDPTYVESKESVMPGLGLLPTSTLFLQPKVTTQVKGTHLESGEGVSGYEIHCGRVQGLGRGKPIFRIQERNGAQVDELDGCQSADQRICGTYLHGLFGEDGFRAHFLERFRCAKGLPSPLRLSSDPYDELADFVQEHIDLKEITPWIPLVSS